MAETTPKAPTAELRWRTGDAERRIGAIEEHQLTTEREVSELREARIDIQRQLDRLFYLCSGTAIGVAVGLVLSLTGIHR